MKIIKSENNYPPKLDPGIYKCKIHSVEDGQKEGKKPYTNIKVHVYSNGDFREVNYFMSHAYYPKIKNTLSSFGIEFEGKEDIDTRLLVNKHAYCEIERNPDTYTNKETGETREYKRHDIARFIHVDDAEYAIKEYSWRNPIAKEDAPIAKHDIDTPEVEEDDIPF